MNHRSGTETLPMQGSLAAEPALRAGESVCAWRFDGFEFDLRRGELYGPGGTAIALRPKAEMLLRQFLANPGRLFGREELIAVLWPAAVVTDDSLVQCVGELRSVLGDAAQRIIHTVSRRGYRWDVPVEPVVDAPARAAPASAAATARRAVQGELQPESTAQAPPDGRRLWSIRLLGLGALGVALAALTGAAALYWGLPAAPIRIDEQIAARNTVAVFSLAVSGDERELRQTADAVADEISAQFSTRLGMRGIGRTATTAQDGSPLALSRVASTLKATHVVTGRVARAAGSEGVAVDVQLSSVASGEVIWAKHFEQGPAGAAVLVTDIGQQVVNAMRIRPHDRVAAAAPDAKPDAVELTLLGWRELDRRRSLEDVLRARTRFEAALREDPDSLIALHGLATSYGHQRTDPTAGLTAAQWAEHERVVDRILKLAPEGSTGLMMWGSLRMARGRADLALPAFEKASLLVPSYPYGYVLIGRAKLLLGRTAEVQAHADHAIRLGAGDPRRVSAAFLLAAEAALMLGEDERAYDLASHSVAAQPSNPQGHATLAAIDALHGRSDRAASEMAIFLKLWPTATVAGYDTLQPSTHAVYLAQRERLYEGLRMAGLSPR